jgi:protein involved in polysaccharide export with SLBB domain
MVARFHYDDLILQRFLADQLAEGEHGEVTVHIEDCRDCQSRLEAIADAGVGWEKVRRLLQPEEKFARRHAGSTAGDACRLDFLQPSTDPKSLGRFGRYEISEILGCGGMGVVLRGYDPALDRHSAIKVLAPELATRASARQRFSREAKSAAAVVHEHVIPIQTVDEERGLPYLVMPVVEGKSLEQRVRESGPLQLNEVLRIGMQIASGLAAAHAQGLVHRDVKPANILLENGVERVMITDFGLARAVDDASMTQSGTVTGTPQYMSPEQARGGDVDYRSDLFSLGSVLYFMCTGHSPFRAESTMAVLNRIAHDAPRSLQTINPDCPLWMQDIVERLLEKEPVRRFQSATEVAQLLGQWLAHVQQPDVAPRPAAVGRPGILCGAAPSPDRTKAVAAGIALGLLLLLSAVVVVLEWNKGTLTIECPRSPVAVRIMKGDQVHQKLTVTPTHHSVRLAAGEYVVEIDGASDGLKVEDDTVTVTRGNTHVVRITQREKPLADGESRHAASPPPTSAESPVAVGLRALKLLQGTWITTRRIGAASPEPSDPTTSLRLVIDNAGFTMEPLDSQQNSLGQYGGQLSVNSKRTPWQIQLAFRLKPPPMSLFGECQVENDRMTITITGANNSREFIGPVPAVWELVRVTQEADVGLGDYRVGPGDVLGIFIEGVMGQSADIHTPVPAAIRSPRPSALPPAFGVPVVVESDGDIRLPYVPALKIAGMTLRHVHEALESAFTKDRPILAPGRNRILVTLVERVTPQRRGLLASYRIRPGDVLAVYVKGVLGDDREMGPIHFPSDARLPPAIGYPCFVSAEGQVHLPFIPSLKVEGLSLTELRERIVSAYTVEQSILQPGNACVLVSVMQLQGSAAAAAPSGVQ